MQPQEKRRRAADRSSLKEAIEALEQRIMMIVSGMLRHMSEESKRSREQTAKDI